MDMLLKATLPAELWLIILDMVIATGVTLLEQCDHISFPDIHIHLQSRAILAPIEHSHRQLRLVCRTFNNLIGTSPCYIMGSFQNSIPTNARAVYVPWLLQEPLISHRLLHLDTFSSDFESSSMPTAFDLLCASSASLPNLRCLTLRLASSSRNMKLSFLALLNDAFPLLFRIVLIQYYDFVPFVHWERGGDTTDITFQNVEVLSLGSDIPCPSAVLFPRLRHIALHACDDTALAMLALSPLLESALFQHINRGIVIDLKSFPRLRLLGVPEDMTCFIIPVGGDHALEHLWLYPKMSFSYQEAILSITLLLKRLPGVFRITMDASIEWLASPERELQMANFRSVGLSISSEGSRIILKRTGQHESIKPHPFLSWVRNKFRR